MSVKSIKDVSIYDSGIKETLSVQLDIDKRSQLEKKISSARLSLCQFMQQFKAETKKTKEIIETSKKEVNSQLDYIRSETRILPKVVFISLSGFGGLLLAFRRSTPKKVFYSGLTATGATALCYPNEAKQYSNQVAEYTKNKTRRIFDDYIWPRRETNRSRKVIINKNPKDKVVQLDKVESTEESERKISGDKGQSNDDDKDMYTTR